MEITNTLKIGFSAARKIYKANSHIIKAGAAMAGAGAACVASYKAYPVVHERIEKAEELKGDTLTNMEKVIAGAPGLASPAALLLLSEMLMLWSVKDANGKILGLALLATAKRDELEEWKKKTEELVGTAKATEIKQEIASDHISKEMEGGWQWPQIPDDGKFWWRDDLTGQMFRANTSDVEVAVAQTEASLANGECMQFDDIAWRLGIKECTASATAYWDPEESRRILYEVNYIKGPKGEPAAEIVWTNLQFR